MKSAIIVAIGVNYVIGNENKLPWQGELPADMDHFRDITTGHCVLMGRKTWDSIPLKFRPLPNRTNIVLTRDTHFRAEGALVCPSLPSALTLAVNCTLFVAGGAQVYEEALPIVDEIYLTVVHHEFAGGVRFPRLNLGDWITVSNEDHEASERNKYRYSFLHLVRKGGAHE